MKPRATFAIALSLVFVSVALLLHAFGGYQNATNLVLPSAEALSPESLSQRVTSEVVPLLPVGEQGAAARSLLQSQASGAEAVHKLWVTQATSTARMAGIQVAAWCIVLAASLALSCFLWPRKQSAA